MYFLSSVRVRLNNKLIVCLAIICPLAVRRAARVGANTSTTASKVGPNYCQPAAEVADHWIDDKDPNVSSEPANDASWWQTFMIRFSTVLFKMPTSRT